MDNSIPGREFHVGRTVVGESENFERSNHIGVQILSRLCSLRRAGGPPETEQ